MRSSPSTRLGLSVAIGLVVLACALFAGDAGSATAEEVTPTYHASAVKGQLVEFEISAPPEAPQVSFGLHGTEIEDRLVDTEPPFRFTIPTAGLRPRYYRWGSGASGEGGKCCFYWSTGGSIQIYPLPRLRAPKVSALVLAGTARVVGLVVSRVGPGKAVRAWSSPQSPAAGEVRRLPLQLRQSKRVKRVYRFAGGASVMIGRRTEIDVEVAPARLTLRHGVELRGRLARLWLTHNRRTGKTRAHRIPVVPCTTIAARKESRPGRVSCTTAPENPPVSILCAKSVPCVEGTAALAGRDQS